MTQELNSAQPIKTEVTTKEIVGSSAALAGETLKMIGVEPTKPPQNAHEFWNAVDEHGGEGESNSQGNGADAGSDFWNNFSDDKTIIAGGEIVSPTASRVGETSFKPAMERGWLAAITSAYGKSDIPINDRQANVVDIVEKAKAQGVPVDILRTHLESLGIKVISKAKAASVSTPETNITASDALENLKIVDNSFDAETSSMILDVCRDWIKYGGNFYDHLTGKDPRLERGVDFQDTPDGKLDMNSYREARRKKIQAWLQDPGNQQWLSEANQFTQNHQNEISFQPEQVRVRNADGTVSEKSRYTTPYMMENAWLYYESNYFDKNSGAMTQPDRESTKYRVYFSPNGENVMRTFEDVIAQLNQIPELQKAGFQIKTAEASRLGENEISSIMNQKDRVVLYLGEEGMKAALPYLQQYAEANRQKFGNEGVMLGQPLTDTQGSEIPGVVVTSEPRGKSPDPKKPGEYRSFSDVQDRIIESSLQSIVDTLRLPQRASEVQSKYPKVYNAMQQLGSNASLKECLKLILADPDGTAMLQRNLQTVYPQWAKAYGISTSNIAFQVN